MHSENYFKNYFMSYFSEEETHELPDGQIIRLKDERFLCTEILFQPHIVGKEIPGTLFLVPVVQGVVYKVYIDFSSQESMDVSISPLMLAILIFGKKCFQPLSSPEGIPFLLGSVRA
jgi:hypothetical protein